MRSKTKEGPSHFRTADSIKLLETPEGREQLKRLAKSLGWKKKDMALENLAMLASPTSPNEYQTDGIKDGKDYPVRGTYVPPHKTRSSHH